MKNTITKWLLRLDEKGQFIITPKEINRAIPINRMLDEVGFYGLDSITVADTTYMIVVKSAELQTKKSVILVSRIEKDTSGERLIDMDEDDRPNMKVIAHNYFEIKEVERATLS